MRSHRRERPKRWPPLHGRAIVPIGAGLVAGVTAIGDAPLSGSDVAALAVIGVALAAAGALAPRAALAALLAASACLGAALLGRARLAALPSGALARALRDAAGAEGRDAMVALEGDVVGLPIRDVPSPGMRRGERESRFVLAVDRCVAGGAVVAARGRVAVRVRDDLAPGLSGARVRVVGRLRPPPLASRPGERDPSTAALDRGVCGALVTRPGALAVVAPAARANVAARLACLREGALDALRARMQGVALGVAAALSLGLYDFAPREVLDAHARTGALPFLAVSGVHVAMVAAPVAFVLARATSRRRAAAMLVAFLAGYGGFTGFAAPVLRSAAGAALVALAPISRRRAEGLAGLAAAATLEALVDAPAVLSASFRLSYVAVLGFVLVLRAWSPPIRPAWLRRSVAMGVVAFLSTAGVTADAFGDVAPGSVVVNPPLECLMPPMLATSLGASLPGPIGDACAWAFEGLERAERALIETVDRLPATPIYAPGVPALAIGAAGACVLLALRRAWRASLVAALVAAGALAARPSPPRGGVELLLHSVGHGLAVTVVLPDGTSAQIDAGSLDRDDAGVVVADALARFGVRRLAVASVSHADSDHGNAMESLLARVPADGWIAREDNPWSSPLRRATRRPAPAAALLEAGDARVRWIEIDASAQAHDNDRAIVTLVEFAGRRVVLPADVEAPGARELVHRMPALRADVLVLPHHGLDNGQIEILLDALRPAIVLASNGARYSTAHAERLVEESGLALHCTRDLGRIRVRIEPDGRVTVRGFRRAP